MQQFQAHVLDTHSLYVFGVYGATRGTVVFMETVITRDFVENVIMQADRRRELNTQIWFELKRTRSMWKILSVTISSYKSDFVYLFFYELESPKPSN